MYKDAYDTNFRLLLSLEQRSLSVFDEFERASDSEMPLQLTSSDANPLSMFARHSAGTDKNLLLYRFTPLSLKKVVTLDVAQHGFYAAQFTIYCKTNPP